MRILRALLVIGIVAGAGAPAGAGVLSISPTRLTVHPDSKVIAFNLRNGGDDEALVEVAIFAWSDVDDPTALEPTRDFLIVPPVAEVPAGGTQILRLAPRVAGDLDEERMYRLVITEIPPEVGPDNGIGFALEMSLPVFLLPDGAAADPAWSLRWKDVATPELALANRGGAHLRVRSFELLDRPDGKSLFKSDDAAYVLAGEEKRWPLEADLAGLKGPVTLKAELTSGSIETLVSLPDG